MNYISITSQAYEATLPSSFDAPVTSNTNAAVWWEIKVTADVISAR
jgi:hypothetical protein